jgi:predicted DNA-binding protein (MmcQ/YjbR family)
MFIEEIRKHCLAKKGVTESFPFDEETLVFKVMNKMFCLMNIVPPVSINLKCDPEKAVELRERFDGVEPGFHMNKKHWNTIKPELITDVKLIYEWIDDSYNLVVQGLSRKDKEALNQFR